MAEKKVKEPVEIVEGDKVALEEITNAKLRQDLDDKCSMYRAYGVQAKEAAAEFTTKQAELMPQIIALAKRAGVKSVTAPDWILLGSNRWSKDKVDPVKLLKKGIPQRIIDACTIKGKPGKPVWQVRGRKDKSEEEEE